MVENIEGATGGGYDTADEDAVTGELTGTLKRIGEGNGNAAEHTLTGER